MSSTTREELRERFSTMTPEERTATTFNLILEGAEVRAADARDAFIEKCLERLDRRVAAAQESA